MNLAIIPASLYAKATFIRNQLRGGISTDDDRYPLPMLIESIVSVSAEIIDAELQQRYNSGFMYDMDLLVVDPLILVKEQEYIPESPVIFLRCQRPATAQWKGASAIRYIKSKFDPAEWAQADSEMDAIQRATKQAYHPAKPAYWYDGPDIRVALPLSNSLLRDAVISYLPARLDTYADGSKIDIYEDAFRLPDRLWSTVWQTVFKTVGANLIQTSPNRDETNNGADTTANTQAK